MGLLRVPLALGLAALALGAASCSAPAKAPQPSPAAPEQTVVGEGDAAVSPSADGTGGGAGGDENLTPRQLTGVPGIDQSQDLVVKILDARGTGRVGGLPIAAGKTSAVPPGQWMLTDEGSEYEITLRSTILPDGIVRLSGASAFLVEIPTAEPTPRFRVFGGTASFYLPNLPLGETVILTPAGPLVTRGAVFTVAVAPDSQVLVTCRDGAVFLTGAQNAVAQPGQVIVADRLGRNRLYDMTPSEAQVFADRWLKVMTEGSPSVLENLLDRRVAAWKALAPRTSAEEARFLALWFRQARSLLGDRVPGPELWSGPLAEPIRPTPWQTPLRTPGLLGELP